MGNKGDRKLLSLGNKGDKKLLSLFFKSICPKGSEMKMSNINVMEKMAE